jgi:N-methylhydantoinase B/oxoprolinase/acetone carboxylase alpha subunit
MAYEDDLLTLAEATRRANVSEMTLRKYLKPTDSHPKSRLPNARKILREGDRQETWAIPLSDLFNAGLIDTSKAADKPTEAPKPVETIEALKATIEGLKREIARLEETIARADRDHEREVSRLSFYEKSFQSQIETAAKQNERRRFWQR